MPEIKLADMKFTKDELKEEKREHMAGPSNPYPWGLSIRLESSELKKLGIDKLPSVNDEWHLIGVAEVTGVNQSARVGQEDETCVALQITMLQVQSKESAAMERAEGAQTPAKEAAEMKR